MTSTVPTYVQYLTAAGVKYYYEPTTKQTTYTFPSHAIIMDAQTKQVIYAPPGITVKITPAGGGGESSTSTGQETQVSQTNPAQSLNHHSSQPLNQSLNSSLNQPLSPPLNPAFHPPLTQLSNQHPIPPLNPPLNPPLIPPLNPPSINPAGSSHSNSSLNNTGFLRTSASGGIPAQSSSPVSQNQFPNIQFPATGFPFGKKLPGIISPKINSDSVPFMPEFMFPNELPKQINISPFTANIKNIAIPDYDVLPFPQIKIADDAPEIETDNPFDYPEDVLAYAREAPEQKFDPAILDSGSNSETSTVSCQTVYAPNSSHITPSSMGCAPSATSSIDASDLANPIAPPQVPHPDTPVAPGEEVKVPFLIIELVANAYRIEPTKIMSRSAIASLVDQYDFVDYARDNFRNEKSTSKKGSDKGEDALISFSDKPLQKPLLKKLKPNLKTFGTTISTSILQFMGVIHGHNMIVVARNLCKILQVHPELVDEAFFQIIKQTTNNPNPKWTENGYLLFIIISYLFRPRKSLRPYIISYSVKHLLDPVFKVRELFSFSLIRLESRFLRSNYKDEITIDLVKSIPALLERAQTLFYCSICEIMWFQRKKYPKLTIPLPLFVIVKELLNKKALQTKNLLDLPVNDSIIDQWILDMTNDYHVIEKGTVGDLMGLLKRWLFTISDPIVPRATFNSFVHCETKEDLLNYAITILSPHLESLKYLIGFLQDILAHGAENGATFDKIADTFGPLIVNPAELIHTQEIVDAINNKGIEFIQLLVKTWKVTDVYPPTNEVLSEAPPKKKVKDVSRPQSQDRPMSQDRIPMSEDVPPVASQDISDRPSSENLSHKSYQPKPPVHLAALPAIRPGSQAPVMAQQAPPKPLVIPSDEPSEDSTTPILNKQPENKPKAPSPTPPSSATAGTSPHSGQSTSMPSQQVGNQHIYSPTHPYLQHQQFQAQIQQRHQQMQQQQAAKMQQRQQQQYYQMRPTQPTQPAQQPTQQQPVQQQGQRIGANIPPQQTNQVAGPQIRPAPLQSPFQMQRGNPSGSVQMQRGAWANPKSSKS
ncbi:hypothetical protein TRFO_20157 [Tritrichomonas foetus]|uniref:Rho-GAP domain-containing protein n=1 Tax=Tritrichomonas foetus TaxID=1144522 RepID=A0A1J4KLD0_9EUKA|nr:hypothetical protein TRFO_20157 [Tritrichomonas foetus]|eukprot:OHT10494.1 hypothetical protein TRFO_20157 [Tritrichomonas foetus]